MIGPSLGLTGRQVQVMLRTAAQAPSVHNSQPWLFAVHPDRIELFADLSRRLPHADPLGKGLRLSCGAVLMNLRLLLEAQGFRPLVSLLPTGGDAGLMAILRSGGRVAPDGAAARLAEAIPRRVSNRRPFEDVAVAATIRVALERAAQSEGAWATVIPDAADRADIRRLIATANRDQLTDPGYCEELAAWTSGRRGLLDGVPSMSAGPAPELQDEWVLRDFAAGEGVARTAGKDFEPEPMIIVVSSYFDSPLGELIAGQALQNVLLTATVQGLAASLLSQPLEVGRTRKELHRVIGTALHPQTIVRLGYGSPVPRAPRRSIEDMVIIPALR